MVAVLAFLNLGFVGRPSTSAPSASAGYSAFWDACAEREAAIDAWEKRRGLKVTDEWLGGADLLRSVGKVMRDQEEANQMRDELSTNCQVEWDRSSKRGEPFQR